MNDELEANVFYEPRPAVAPFYVVPADATFNTYLGDSYDNRANAEEMARALSEFHEEPYHVLGCVSISSVPKPVPLKASTRALV